MKPLNKTFLFIDGTNLYAGQYDLFGPKKYLDFPKFIDEVQKKLAVKFDKIYFYATYSPKPKHLTIKIKLYLKNEAMFYQSVRRKQNLVFFQGYRSKTSGKEKEVDVKLAVDAVHLAHLDKFHSLYLLSGDADFFHVLTTVRSINKKVYVICLQNKLMKKAIFNFKTSIIVFDKKGLFNIPKTRQKIKILELNPSLITKSPPMHALGVG